MTTSTIDPARYASASADAPAVHRQRHGAIDALRMAAVVPIVFYHAGVLAQLPALIGMHALIAAAIVFAARSRGRGSATEIVSRRASRLLVPWLFFGLLHLVMALRSGSWRPWMFLIGGSMHLWFVPFIFVATCAVALACRDRAWPRSWNRVALWSVAALALIYIEACVTPTIVDRVPLWQFLNGATAVLVALAALSAPTARSGVAVAAVLALVSVACWVPVRTPAMMWVSPAGFGTLLFFVVAAIPAASNRFTDFLGRAAFGVYLLHPLVLTALEKVVARVLHVPMAELERSIVLACAVATVLLCVALIAVIERTPFRRVVV